MKSKLIIKSVLLFLINLKLSKSHESLGYSFEASSSLYLPKWMGELLNDSTSITDISIPGTHESLSFDYYGVASQCQTLPLPIQLEIGIRALDIQCRHSSNQLLIYHGRVSERMLFNESLNIIVNFLQNNPSEFIFIRMREANRPELNNRTFAETFESYKNDSKYIKYFWTPNGQFPLVRDVRGKIIVLDDFSGTNNYGLNYKDRINLFEIQDDYWFTTNWELYDKWIKVKEFLIETNLTRGNEERDKKIYMNYLVGAGGSFPYFVASGHVFPGTFDPRLSTGLTIPGFIYHYPDFPRVSCFLGTCTIAFEGTNVLTYNYIRENGGSGELQFVGIIMADFPGDGLISSIIGLNKKKIKNSGLKMKDSYFTPLEFYWGLKESSPFLYTYWGLVFLAGFLTFVLIISLFKLLTIYCKTMKRESNEIDETNNETNDETPLIVVDPPLIVVDPPLIVVDPPLIVVDPPLIVVDPPLIVVEPHQDPIIQRYSSSN